MPEFLFDVSNDPSPLDQTLPLSHRGDPVTSYEAAEQFRRSGKRAYHWWIILEGMKQCNGGTHSEIAAVTPLDWLQVARRLSELERAGLVRKGEPRICRVKGSRCCTWWLIERDFTDDDDGAGESDQTVANRTGDTENAAHGASTCTMRVYTSEPTDTVEVTRGGTTYTQKSQKKGIGRDERRRSRYGERWVNG